ncbi:hypothetical protein ARMGADRAFT_1158223 [Armillaria gallica]|uniref:Uncharacterized protein n=1 Tax=Armillaria gallica TaxID=47427 RepID=A0A2H3F1H9_ARMGA|nr:hypothetical protein ARMGADRAFT_1158223 [Armillaria gallica]
MDESALLLPISCRFIPYDQWLTTHVDPAWKVKQVKHWILSKCISHIKEEVDIEVPEPRHRSPSPIVFAPPKHHRPISPIEFSTRVGSGYEEDDEADAEGDDVQKLPAQLPSTSALPAAEPPPPAKLKARRKKKSTSSSEPIHPHHRSAYEPSRLTLLRFSTGQILEDDFAFAWYDIQPGELFEVHRVGVVLKLQRTAPSEYAKPYWEGWAKAVTNSNGKKKNVMGDGGKESKVEWKDRWVVVREGTMQLCKDRSDPIPHKALFLSHLTAIRGSDHLKQNTIEVTPEMRIICAKFKIRSSVTTSTVVETVSSEKDTVPSTTFTVISPPKKPSPPLTIDLRRTRKRASTISHLPRKTGHDSDSTNPDGEDDSDSTLSSPVFAHDPTDEDGDDHDDENDIKSVLGLPRYRYRHDRAIKIRGSAEDDDDLPSIDPPGEKSSEIGEWIVLDLLEDSGYLSLLRTLHRLFPHEHLSVCEASTFVSSLLPSLDSPSTPIPPTPPPTSTSTHPSSLLPSLPHNYGALAFPEWRTELVHRARKAGMGNIGGAMGCLMWGLAHMREEEEEVEEDESDTGSLAEWDGWMVDLARQATAMKEREKEPANDEDYEDEEEDDADYYQEQSDRMALEPSGVVTSVPPFASPATTPPLSSPSSSESLYRRSGALNVNVLVDGHGRELRHSRSDEPQLHEQGPARRPSMPSLLFGGSSVGRSSSVLRKGKGKEKRKDRARSIHHDESAEMDGKKKSGLARGMEKLVRGLDPTLDFVDPR